MILLETQRSVPAYSACRMLQQKFEASPHGLRFHVKPMLSRMSFQVHCTWGSESSVQEVTAALLQRLIRDAVAI